MSANQFTCSAESIEQYLSQRLTDVEQSLVEDHLDSCESCRSLMEQMAAEDRFWLTARHALSAATSETTVDLRNQGDTRTNLHNQSLERLLGTILTPSVDSDKLGRIGNYEVSGVVGHGAMGIVLQAYDDSLDRMVAIKVLTPTLSAQGSARQRFEREARAAAAVVHPNVIAIHGIAESHGLPYLVMPFVSGGSLQEWVEYRAPLSVIPILTIGQQIALGLAAAHEKGLVHRDIKPSNILLEDGIDHVLISDFGLAQAADEQALTHSGVIAGTPLYMSPEQARGEAIDARSDLFSFGSLLYMLATGQAPFSSETAYGVLRKITDAEAVPMRRINPEIPEPLRVIVSRLHAKHAASRFASASEVAELLQQYRNHLLHPQTVPLPRVLRSHAGFTFRIRRLLQWGSVCVVLLGLTFWGRSFWKGSNTLPKAPPTVSEKNESLRRYVFPTDHRSGYLVTMFAELPDSDIQIEGLLTISANDHDDNMQLLEISNQLQLQRSRSAEALAMDGFVIERMPGERSQRINQTNGTRLTIDGTGEVTVLQESLALPFGLGSLTGLMFPGPPNETTSVSHNSERDVIVSQAIMIGDAPSLSSHGTATSTFAANTGELNSVKTDVTLILTTELEVRRIPVRVSFVRLNDDERAAWLASRGALNTVKDRPPFSPDEKAELLVDLSAHHRVLYWLDEIERRDPSLFSADVVDAVLQITDHHNPSLSTLAARIVREIPEAQLNPFREVDDPP